MSDRDTREREVPGAAMPGRKPMPGAAAGLAVLLLLVVVVCGYVASLPFRPFIAAVVSIYSERIEVTVGVHGPADSVFDAAPDRAARDPAVPGRLSRIHPEAIVGAAESEAELARRSAWLQVARPWQVAGYSRIEARHLERLDYARDMASAPMLCRQALRARLPEGWSAAPIALGRSVSGPEYLSWRVTGWTTVTGPAGSGRRYDYVCDLDGHTVADVTLTDVYGHSNVLVVEGGR